jgi:hypothetical protein
MLFTNNEGAGLAKKEDGNGKQIKDLDDASCLDYNLPDSGKAMDKAL